MTDAHADARLRLSVDVTSRRSGAPDTEKDKIGQPALSPTSTIRALSPGRALPRGFGGTIGKKELEKFTAQERQRQEVIFEFIDTERAYVNDLRLLVTKLLHPALEKGVLTKEDAGHLCLNVETLLELNADLLSELEALQASSGYIVPGIGPTLLTRSDRLKLYAVYCAHFKQPTYEEMRARLPKFATFVDDVLKGEEWRGVPLHAYLHKPVARICKYPLLLRELLKCTPETLADHAPLTEAYERICAVVDRINERTRQVEAMRKLDEIEKSLDGAKDLMLAQLTRRFVREVNCKDTKKDDVHLFLFNDLLLVARPRHKKARYEVKKNGPLTSLAIQDASSDARVLEVVWPDTTKDSFEFATAEEKTAWRNEMQQWITTGKAEEAKRKPVALHIASTNAQAQANGRASGRGKLTRTISDSNIKNQALKPAVAASPSALDSPTQSKELKPKIPVLLVGSVSSDAKPDMPLSAGRRSMYAHLIDVGRVESSPRSARKPSNPTGTDSPRRHKDIASISKDDLIKEVNQLQNDKEMLTAAMAQMKADMVRVTVGLKEEITSLKERLQAVEKERDELKAKAK